MDWFSGIVVFIITWWTVLFMVLPIGVRQPDERPPEHADGAPANPRIVRKFAMTTLVSAVVWLVIFGLIQADILSFHDLARDL